MNIGPAERAGRVLLGLAAAIIAIIPLTTVGGAPAVVLKVLLLPAGPDLMITGATGHCPLYAKPGHVPRARRSRT
ncbi:DUF2892 domain-containing protein [Streptomyces sp. NBRC 110028]|uniref:YgaP family membrane protein n=1 Tax=Streptomyces sp. NBRC 110028 TaxID=1621260 RepID=UPI0006E2A58E|nr:DUF2892 domain-containing protein [Streptomyces sp. NBRC 110028]